MPLRLVILLGAMHGKNLPLFLSSHQRRNRSQRRKKKKKKSPSQIHKKVMLVKRSFP
jgi:hypothetical protein